MNTATEQYERERNRLKAERSKQQRRNEDVEKKMARREKERVRSQQAREAEDEEVATARREKERVRSQ